MGAAFARLPAPVRALHLRAGWAIYHGEVEVQRGAGWLSRLMSFATHLPPAGQGPLRVEIESDAAGERWVRHIGGRAMPSRLWFGDGLLRERLGLARFGFALDEEDGAIVWRVVQVHVLGLPLPAGWFAGVSAREFSVGARYHFDVRAALPLAGLLVHYCGWLDVASPEATD